MKLGSITFNTAGKNYHIRQQWNAEAITERDRQRIADALEKILRDIRQGILKSNRLYEPFQARSADPCEKGTER